MTENAYQTKLIKKLKKMFPDCEILKNDSGYKQGILDLTILFGARWAMLEVKAAAGSKRQPNQDYFVERMNKMSFASYIHPGNEKEVLIALQKALAPRRSTRVPQP